MKTGERVGSWQGNRGDEARTTRCVTGRGSQVMGKVPETPGGGTGNVKREREKIVL